MSLCPRGVDLDEIITHLLRSKRKFQSFCLRGTNSRPDRHFGSERCSRQSAVVTWWKCRGFGRLKKYQNLIKLGSDADIFCNLTWTSSNTFVFTEEIILIATAACIGEL